MATTNCGPATRFRLRRGRRVPRKSHPSANEDWGFLADTTSLPDFPLLIQDGGEPLLRPDIYAGQCEGSPLAWRQHSTSFVFESDGEEGSRGESRRRRYQFFAIALR